MAARPGRTKASGRGVGPLRDRANVIGSRHASGGSGSASYFRGFPPQHPLLRPRAKAE